MSLSPKNPHAPDQDAIWDYFQNEAPESFEGSGARIDFLVSRVNQTGNRVLDIGVGSGLFEEAAQKRGLDVYALDPSPISIENLRKRFGMEEKAQTGYSQNMPFDSNMFDAVIISEVFEHLSSDVISATLGEIHRVLKPGGRIVGTVPARENLAAQMVVCPDCGKRFHRWGHQQTFDAPRMTNLLSEKFDIITVIERPFIFFKVVNWKGKAVGLLKLILWKLGVHGSLENVFFEAAKR